MRPSKSVTPLARSSREPRTSGATAVEVADALRRKIQDGDLAPGHWLREPWICLEFGVGRSIARSALRSLGEDGLILIEENRGAFVAATTTQEVFDLYELRAGLYGVAARFACFRTSPAVMAQTLDLIDALFADTESGGASAEALIHQSEAIFSCLASASSLETQKMIESVRRKTRWHFSYAGLAEGSHPPVVQWRLLRDGLAARDAAMAAEGARSVVHHTQNEVMRLMIARGASRKSASPPARRASG